jgi:uncharacterized Ntn-hydrolase superfamily protein
MSGTPCSIREFAGEAQLVTYSIVAHDFATGDLGVAVQSRFLAVGAVVPWARAGVGAVATQAYGHPGYGPGGLELLAAGAEPEAVVERLTLDDELREERQVGIADRRGRTATFTGRGCYDWAGGRTGPGFAAQGNILAGPAVVDGLVETFVGGGRPFPELLVACLAAAEAAGGDRRGRQSAALLVVREGGGYGGYNDRWIDLRVDDHPAPIEELARLLEMHRLYFDRPRAEDLLPVDEGIAGELRHLLTELGALPGRAATVFEPMDSAAASGSAQRSEVGVPQPAPPGWDDGWQRALLDWMAVENLEERAAAMGWVDPRVLAVLRERAPGG